jgi:hypothetical protein
VANRTRWWYVSFSTKPKATNGCTSPREPTTCMTTFIGGGGLWSDVPPSAGGRNVDRLASSCPCGNFSWLRRAGASRSENLRDF